MKRTLLAVVIAGFAVCPSAMADPTARASATCSDYSNQADAQRAADTRDPDGDGVYCESLPCPCAKPGSGGGGNTSPRPKPKKRKVKREALYSARIVSVTDGDTVKARIAGGSVVTVRVIGIDTPETKRPGVAVECGGPAASGSMKRLAPVGGHVTLRTDPTQDTRDRYSRLLAYVGRNGRDLGRTQVSRGHAKTYVYGGKPFQRTSAYRRSQAKAKRLKRGVYANCGGDFHSDQAGVSAPRLRAYVSCGVSTFRPSHSCFIGDAPYAVFHDSSRSSRRYKVCLRGPGGHFCVRSRQRNGNASQVSLLRFNERVGTYTVKWFVRGKRGSVRRWNFYFALGD